VKAVAPICCLAREFSFVPFPEAAAASKTDGETDTLKIMNNIHRRFMASSLIMLTASGVPAIAVLPEQ
jgi:hypothetical protein